MTEQQHDNDESSNDLARLSQAESIFEDIELFDGLTGQEMREVVEACQRQSVQAGDVLFEQGDQSDALFIIGDGKLEVVGRSSVGEKVVLAVLEPGTAVGEMSLIEGGPRSATVQAVTESRVFRLDHDTFDAMRSQHRPAAYKIILGLAATVGDRRRTTDARVRQVFQDPAAHIDSFESQLHEMLGRLRKS